MRAKVTVPRSSRPERVGPRPPVGPFPHLGPGATRRGRQGGTFVEVKNSTCAGERFRIAYVGDADVGAGTNLGAGTITANYDGFRKNRTKIGEVREAELTIARRTVSIGDGAYTGAGR